MLSRLLAASTAARRASATTIAAACSSSSSSAPYSSTSTRATTVLCVRKDGQVVVVADGQVTRGAEVVKPNVRKVRRLGGGAAIGGFAGATADAFTLWERLEQQLEAHPGQLTRAAVELAKAWRSDKYLRRSLDASMVVADAKQSLTISGNGDVLEPHDGVLAVGSGAPYALAAARALVAAGAPGLDALTIAKHAMNIAADACIYTNHNFVIETLESTADAPGDGSGGGGGGAAPATTTTTKKGKTAS